MGILGLEGLRVGAISRIDDDDPVREESERSWSVLTPLDLTPETADIILIVGKIFTIFAQITQNKLIFLFPSQWFKIGVANVYVGCGVVCWW